MELKGRVQCARTATGEGRGGRPPHSNAESEGRPPAGLLTCEVLSFEGRTKLKRQKLSMSGRLYYELSVSNSSLYPVLYDYCMFNVGNKPWA